MPAVLILSLLLTAAEPGFGGDVADLPATTTADDFGSDDPGSDRDPQRDAIDDVPLPQRDEFVGGSSSRTTAVFPTTAPEPPAPKKTALEIELEKARLDPARFPLIQLRVDVARLEADRKESESRGLSATTEIRARLIAAQAILADVERIALHRLNVCSTRNGSRTVVKNYKMTAAGPVRLSNAELLSQTSFIDPEGCARIELVDEAVVARVKRAHELRHILKTTTFAFHKLDDKRALEREQQNLLKELAKEDVPVITLSGGTDPY